MDLTPRLLSDLDDVTTLYERKLCGLAVVQLQVSRAGQALRLDKPEWSDQLAALANRIGEADARKVEWIEGMALMDTIRAWIKNPPAAPPPPLELVESQPVAAVEPVPDAEVEPVDELPVDVTEPATPRNFPTRNL